MGVRALGGRGQHHSSFFEFFAKGVPRRVEKRHRPALREWLQCWRETASAAARAFESQCVPLRARNLPCELAHQERLARPEGLVDAVVEVFALVGTDGVLRHVKRVEHLAQEGLLGARGSLPGRSANCAEARGSEYSESLGLNKWRS